MSLRLTLDHLLELHPGKLLGREEQDRGCNEAEEGELPVIPKSGLGSDFLSRENQREQNLSLPQRLFIGVFGTDYVQSTHCSLPL